MLHSYPIYDDHIHIFIYFNHNYLSIYILHYMTDESRGLHAISSRPVDDDRRAFKHQHLPYASPPKSCEGDSIHFHRTP